MTSRTDDRSWITLHRLALVLAVMTFGLIVWGGHVNSTRSGMAFPDWPTSNAAPMLTYHPSEWLWQSDRFWEHGHRLYASVVGLVTVLLMAFTLRATPSERRGGWTVLAIDAAVFLTVATAIVGINSMPSVFTELVMAGLAILMAIFFMKAVRSQDIVRIHWLSQAAFAGVCLQACFGGYTVRNNLPDWTSTTHGMLAEVFLITILGIVYLTSASYRAGTVRNTLSAGTRKLVMATWLVTVVQFFLGALTRHTDAWGVSMVWPAWSETELFPTADMWAYSQVVIHFVHRTMAYVVAAMIILQVVRYRRGTTITAALLVGVQIFLGAAILWTYRGELVTTLHVMTGVLLVILNTWSMFAASSAAAPERRTVTTTPDLGVGRAVRS